MGNFTDLDMYLLGQSTHYDIYKKLGAHLTTYKRKKGVMFDLWAPGAKRVWVIGTFNDWNETKHEMERLKPEECGIYELFVPDAKQGDMYKYLIETADGEHLYKADPYANQSELRPGTASIVADIDHFKWTDAEWMKERAAKDVFKEPMAILEVHAEGYRAHPEPARARVCGDGL